MAETTTNRRPSRARVVLIVVIVILALLLLALGVFFFRVLTPAGPLDEQGGGDGGLVWVRSMYGFGPTAEEQLLDPTSVAIGLNGEVYVSDPQAHRVMLFSPDGTFLRLLHTGAGGVGEGQFYRPESLAVDGDGNVYIADTFGAKIIVFDQDGNYVREWAFTEETGVPRGVHVNGEDVFVLTTGKLFLFDREGNQLGVFGSRGRAPGQIDAYQGVTDDGDRIYIADALNHRVMALDRRGETLWISPPDEADVNKPDAPYDLPTDLCLDGAGRLVTVDAFKFEIVVSDPETGAKIASYAHEGTQEGLFWYPSSIAYDPARDWFAVADTRNNRVQIVRIPDSGGGFGAAVQRLLSSPYRYCAIPLLLLLIALVVAAVTSRRIRRRAAESSDLQESEDF